MKRLVMKHGSIRGSAVNVKKKTKQNIFWDSFPEVDYPISFSIEPFDEKKWNKNYDGSWRKELSAVDDGL